MGGKSGGKTVHTEKFTQSEPIAYYKSKVGLYPSNGEIWWSYKRPLEVGSDKPPKNYIEIFDPALRFQVSLGNSPAPRGHYILNAFFMDRSSASGVPGIDVKSSLGFRPTSTAFYAGRVWYAGTNVAGWNTKFYFSQVVEKDEQVQECYQLEDPTNDTLHDLLETDGGVIVIPEVSEVYNLVPYQMSLLVFAKNGVWEIGGSTQGYGFKANDYSVHKLSGAATLSNMSFVLAEGQPFWWNRTGIYTVTQTQMGGLQVISITDGTIKTYFDNIKEQSKFYAKGAYDTILKRIQWLYRSADVVNENDQYIYDTILNLDLTTNAFYEYKTAETSRVEFIGIFDIEGNAIHEETFNVVVETSQVVVGTSNVIVTKDILTPVDSLFKYIVNVKEVDTSDLPPPPPGPTPQTFDVYVGADRVAVGADLVVYTEVI